MLRGDRKRISRVLDIAARAKVPFSCLCVSLTLEMLGGLLQVTGHFGFQYRNLVVAVMLTLRGPHTHWSEGVGAHGTCSQALA